MHVTKTRIVLLVVALIGLAGWQAWQRYWYYLPGLALGFGGTDGDAWAWGLLMRQPVVASTAELGRRTSRSHPLTAAHKAVGRR